MLLEDGTSLSTGLEAAPTDPMVPGPVRDAVLGFVEDKLVRTDQAKGETVYLPVDDRRVQLAYYKNTILNLVAPARAGGLRRPARELLDRLRESVRTEALFLSRLFKLEFIYRVGTPFEIIFTETVDRLVAGGVLLRKDEMLVPARCPGPPAARVPGGHHPRLTSSRTCSPR
jgi:glycerol-3-phosphate O-acyltransferase